MMSVSARLCVAATAMAAAALLACSPSVSAQEAGEDPTSGAAVFTAIVSDDGDIALPTGFERWPHLGAWAVRTPDGDIEGFHNVYVTSGAIEAWRETGAWPDQTVMVKEVRGADHGPHTTGDAHWANDEVAVWFVMVKDTQERFADNALWGDGWGWALYNGDSRTTQVATDYRADCLGCHTPVRELDWVHVYAYPTLGERAAAMQPAALRAPEDE